MKIFNHNIITSETITFNSIVRNTLEIMGGITIINPIYIITMVLQTMTFSSTNLLREITG